ncbi:hypothetical protein OHS59_06805 [Streptomyces sp. NBC_00414]|uniref:hypothetical protein n=1 Tax=Streptomyces sp. NBC_00414 TaxID=2975739 RepID=UPI002E1DB1F2
MREAVIKAGVASDANYMGRLFGDIVNSADSSGEGVIPLCMTPYVSLVIHEAQAKPQTIDPSAFDSFTDDAREVCARARHSLKLFEDTRRGTDGQLRFFEDEILKKHSSHFLGNTWLPPARFLESDLSLFTYNETLISTSHAAAFHIGMRTERLFHKDNEAYVRATMEKMGRCLYALGARLDAEGPRTFVRNLSREGVRHRDTRAAPYYQQGFNGSTTPAINGVLTDFQVRTNFIAFMLTAGSDVLDLEYTVFKIRYITLYQVLTSLMLLKENAAYPLSRESTEILEGITGSEEARLITNSSARGFRNTLMHYNLPGRIDTQRITLDQPLFGLVSIFFPSHNYRSLSELTDRCVKTTAERLNSWADAT